MTEETKTLERFPGYEITSDGRVFSTRSNWRGLGRREMKSFLDRNGYKRVSLAVNKRTEARRVHKLVAEAFLPPRPSSLHVIRHLSGDKFDNRAENLKWGTVQENTDDREAHGTTPRGERQGQAKLCNSDIIEIRRLWREGINKAAIARRMNISRSNISLILSGKAWAHIFEGQPNAN